MIIELRFPTGRFHATAWGRHVNEGVPEWPPSPFRLLRSMLDAWFRKHQDIPSAVVEKLLAGLSTPPRYRLPPARASHTRSYLSQNQEDPSNKKLVFDAFAIVARDESVVMGWPGIELSADCVDAARRLLGSLSYLGRSESWVEARVADDRAVDWNCLPVEPGPIATGEVVPVACVISPDAYEARNFAVEVGRGKKKKKLGWFEALGWGSAETIANTMNRPPAMEVVHYVRPANALDARPPPVRRRSGKVVEAVRFSVDSKVRVPITEALRIGELVRRNLMGALRAVAGADHPSPVFSGKDPTGRPVRGHPHASILSLDEDSDGYIDAILLSNPTPFSVEERRAIDRLRPVPRRNGHPLVLTPIRYGTRKELLVSTTEVVSATPFASQLHWKKKRDGDFGVWLARQVTQECEQRGLPRPIAIERLAPPETKARRFRWLDFRRARKSDAPQPAFGLRIRFGEPVLAPFSLGYGSHYGLGTFVPAVSHRTG
ncbi:MAG: type I-U CRISPR-associated protein Csb2 [Myxococcota bacterium]